MWALKMLRKMPILRAFPLIKSLLSRVSISITVPSAGASRRLVSSGDMRFGSRKNDRIHIKITARTASMRNIAIPASGENTTAAIMVRITAGKTITCGRPYFVNGILINKYGNLGRSKSQEMV